MSTKSKPDHFFEMGLEQLEAVALTRGKKRYD